MDTDRAAIREGLRLALQNAMLVITPSAFDILAEWAYGVHVMARQGALDEAAQDAAGADL